MLYHFGFILVLAAAVNGQKWLKQFRSTTKELKSPLISAVLPTPAYPTTVPEIIQPSSQDSAGTGEVVVGYEPIYGYLERNTTADVSPLADWDFKCPIRFGYYRYKESCDIYVECRNYKVSRKVCPDGMHFKDNPNWAEYPCAYPPEAKCLVRGGELSARPTAECPHQFGNYPITDALRYEKYDRCSSYISCASGVAYVMNCTFGLVFNPKINLCDWPEQVPGCQDVFEFRCPVSHLGEEDMVINYRYPSDPECRFFYSCLNGGYRVLACDDGLLFDHRIGRCVEYEKFVCDYDGTYFIDLRN